MERIIRVPDGARNNPDPGCKEWFADAELPARDHSSNPVYMVVLDHGRNLPVERYFFDSPDDARWFWLQGYKDRLVLGSEEARFAYERMVLVIDNQPVDERINGDLGTTPLKVYALLTHEPPEARIIQMEIDTLPPVVYATREAAQLAADEYNEEFDDPEPATVEEIEVVF